MIDPDFPAQGEKPWGNKLNAALGEMVDASNENEARLPLVLGPTDPIPEGTAPGTVIIRKQA